MHYKEALYNCRCALENISTALWKKIAKVYAVILSVKMRLPNAKPDLMTVINSLNSTIKKHKIEEYIKITDYFDYLLGIKASYNIIWQYLNKGAHDEEGLEDFDSGIVKKIVENITKVNELIKNVNKGST